MPSHLMRNPDAAAVLDAIEEHPWISVRELRALLPEIGDSRMRSAIRRLHQHGFIERRSTGRQRGQWRRR